MPLLYTPPKVAPIPVIDLDPSRAPAEIAADIRAAAVDTGFFYVQNHGVDQRLIDAAFAAVKRFFDLPLEAKERIPRTPTTKGYEGTEKHFVDQGSAPDVKESWNCGWDRGPVTPAFAENKWPAELPEELFRHPIEAYYRALDALGKQFVPLFALSLGLPEDFFAEPSARRSRTATLTATRPSPSFKPT